MKKILLFSIIIVLINIAKGQENKIDPNLEVGSLPGYFNVSSAGAALYTIPIELPSARGGMNPHLAFVYNSQGGSGIMGKGWSLSGFSSIRRVNPTLYHDGKVQQLNFGEDDGFMLDGQRLFKISEHAGGIIEYRTEIDQIAKVLYYPDGDINGIDFWKVSYKNGIVRYYGYTNGSRQYNSETYSGSDYPLVWHISSEHQTGFNSIDVNPNKQFYEINYLYEQDSEFGECHPSKIIYNINQKNTTTDPDFIVDFVYDNLAPENRRTAYYKFKTAHFTNDFRVKNTRRLREIKLSVSDSPNTSIRKYIMNYEYNSLLNEPYLKSIQLQSQGPNTPMEEINKTIFNWSYFNNPNYTIDHISDGYNVPFDDIGSILLTTLDINGDGIDEIAEYKPRNYNEILDYRVYVNISGYGFLIETNAENIVKSLSGADFNNDGKDELIVTNENSVKIYFFNEVNGTWSADPNPYMYPYYQPHLA